jgi:hypothetical protein
MVDSFNFFFFVANLILHLLDLIIFI